MSPWFEPLLLLLVAGAALTRLRGGGRLLVVGAAGIGLLATWPPGAADGSAPAVPGTIGRPDLATSDACRSCHPSEYASWHRTFHRTMTQAATPEAVRGAFDGRVLETEGARMRLRRRGDRFEVDMLGPDDALVRRAPIEMTTGSHHLQNYWMKAPNGWYVQLPWSWLIKEGRWIRVADSFLQPPPREPAVHAWNDGCIYCHTVGGAGGVAAEGDSAASKVGELGIACEACHGPADDHIARHRQPWRRYGARLGGADDDTVLHPERVDPKTSTEVCAQCHASYIYRAGLGENEKGDAFRPGADFGASRILLRVIPAPDGGIGLLPPAGGVTASGQLELEGARVAVAVVGARRDAVFLEAARGEGASLALQSPAATLHFDQFSLHGAVEARPGGAVLKLTLDDRAWAALNAELGYDLPIHPPDLSVFWDDGTSRVAGREYNGLIESGCYTRGELSCLSCHQMHGGTLADQLAEGMEGDVACTGCHPSQAQDVEAHTHHAADSEGSRCYACHMPHTTYGLLGAMRSHRIDSPSAANSARTGRPNACNLCHLDRTLAWTDEKLRAWYGHAPAELSERQRTVATGVLWTMAGDAAQRAIVAWNMGRPETHAAAGRDWMPPFLAGLLDDDYAAVRFIAARALKGRPEMETLDYAFDADQPARQAAGRALLERWSAARHEVAGPALLIPAPGALDLASVQRLLQSRTQRPVYIAE